MIIRYAKPNQHPLGLGWKWNDADLPWTPRTDVKETDRGIILTMDLPGIRQEDITIEFVEDTLVVTGKREMSEEESREDYVRLERVYGEFSRSFKLLVPVKADDISASYKDGVLRIDVPKAPEALPRRIEITAN
ncbi:MAG: Hsp20/alpha crystallin family protein [Fimbriimonadales bacterium]|nr:Hsp20/alpha crystallin family protein [Fimbriimonadales bacterium]